QVERHLAARLVVGLGPAGDQQGREQVIGRLRRADDVEADGVAAVAVPRLHDRLEYGDGALAEGIELAARAEIALDRRDERVVALRTRALQPARIVEALCEHAVMDVRMLTHVERREVKAEGLDPPDQAPHELQAGVAAAIAGEADRDQAEVIEQLPRVLVGLRATLVRAPE